MGTMQYCFISFLFLKKIIIILFHFYPWNLDYVSLYIINVIKNNILGRYTNSNSTFDHEANRKGERERGPLPLSP
jgi:hypothetical protein